MDNEWGSIKIAQPNYRAAITSMLAENGYTVRITRRKEPEKARAYTYYVEYKMEAQNYGG